MEQGKAFLTVTLLWGLVIAGCGSRTGDQAADAPPHEVIAQFLEAVRAGDDDNAARLLTPLARKKTSEMQMVVAPPGSETAKFRVLDTQLAGTAAHVASEWTDLDTDGSPHTDRIVWILHKDANTWRIAGMSTRVFDDQEPIVLDFEDPADMLRKQQQAEEEIARRDRQTPAPGSGADSPATVR
jgi:hypothetical protein